MLRSPISRTLAAPSATHAVIRLLYNSTTYDSPSEICCLKRENDDDCEDRVSYPVSPFVLSFPNSRAFELDGGHMNVLEQFDRYTDEEAKHFYNNAHQDSRGKTKAYRQLVQHQSKIQSLMPVDPATLLIVHNIYFFPERFSDLIRRGGMPDFSAISRSCSSITARAGASASRPPRISAGTRRLDRWLPSS
jgi:hypothetical protein